MVKSDRLAIFYQAAPPPAIDGILKPMKPGGYSDSGADMGFALKSAGVEVVTPKGNPSPTDVFDWVFPDTKEGIESALALGATTLWMNTVLFVGHPMESFFGRGLKFVCQHPHDVQKYDDKFNTNRLLLDRGLQVAHSSVITNDPDKIPKTLRYPLMLKPIRGRGSAGVTLVHSREELLNLLSDWSASQEFGSAYMLEELLPGEEITITVLPAGEYNFGNETQAHSHSWALRPVRRFDHVNMVAPYNGSVPVTENSVALSTEEASNPNLIRVMEACEEVGEILGIRAPIRIDCREDSEGFFRIFDVNPKPNITGAGRPGRESQDSLVMMAARAEGLNYPSFLKAIVANAWSE